MELEDIDQDGFCCTIVIDSRCTRVELEDIDQERFLLHHSHRFSLRSSGVGRY